MSSLEKTASLMPNIKKLKKTKCKGALCKTFLLPKIGRQFPPPASQSYTTNAHVMPKEREREREEMPAPSFPFLRLRPSLGDSVLWGQPSGEERRTSVSLSRFWRVQLKHYFPTFRSRRRGFLHTHTQEGSNRADHTTSGSVRRKSLSLSLFPASWTQRRRTLSTLLPEIMTPWFSRASSSSWNESVVCVLMFVVRSSSQTTDKEEKNPYYYYYYLPT